jgi:hypothetical protein
MLRKLETHHIVGTLSVFQGLSFLLEEYTFSGSFVGLLSATILAATLRASAQLPNDFHPHHHREDDQQ